MKRRQKRREDRRWLIVSRTTSKVSGMRRILWMHRPTQRWMYVCLEVDRRSDPFQKEVRISSGVADEGAVDLNQQEQHRFEPLNGPDLNGPEMICHCQTFSGLRRIDLDRGWWTRRNLEFPSANRLPGLCHPTGRAARQFQGPGGPWRRGNTRLQPDPYDDGLPNKCHDPGSSDKIAG